MLNFSNVVINEASQLIISIANDGNQTLTVSQTDILGNDADRFTFVSGNGAFSISPSGQAHEISIEFSPLSSGPRNATLRIVSNDPVNSSLNIPLNGTGIADPTPAQILIDTSSISLNLNTAFNFSITIAEDNAAIQSASLFAREGGRAMFNEFSLTEGSGDLWTTTVPNNFISERGLEYYIEVRHGGAITLYPENGSNTPAVARVNVPRLVFPGLTLQDDYQKISVPGNAGNQTLANILQDDLGTYNQQEYRVFDWNNAQERFVELNNLNATLPPGKALWLITRTPKALDVETTQSVLTNRSYPVSLAAGWNMIATPFAFPVAWSEVNSTNIQGGTLYFYDGSGWNSAAVLEPFKGYAVFALSATTLQIPPQESSAPVARQAASKSTIGPENQWQIQIKAEKAGYRDHYNFAGVRQTANYAWDRSDILEPPAIGNFVSLYFDHSDWPERAALYAGDYRDPSTERYEFDFVVQSNFSGTATITFEPQEIPPQYDWVVVSPETNVKYPQGGDISTTLNSAAYRLFVGPKSFLETALNLSLIHI